MDMRLGHDWEVLELHVGLVLSFLAGSFLCGLMIHTPKFQTIRRVYAYALWLILVLLFICAVFREQKFTIYLCAMASGLQNGLATGYR